MIIQKRDTSLETVLLGSPNMDSFAQGHMSRVLRKTDFCQCENKDADQLRSNCKADQRLCFRYTDNTIHLLPKSEISSFYPSGLCLT